MKLLITMILCLLFRNNAAFGDDNPLIHNGNFEIASTSLLPEGWSIWGNKKKDVSDNFTLDFSNPRKGKACFRIHREDSQGGYIVTSPEFAICPEKGKTYTVRFWARSDSPGKSVFGYTAYKKMNPFINAPSPGFFYFEATHEWKEFSFSINEGKDFIAEETPYLLLTFKPSLHNETKTLWIDEVYISQKQFLEKDPILDIDKLAYIPLNHRLSPGKSCSIEIDAGKISGLINQNVTGVSFHRVSGWMKLPYDSQGNYTLSKRLEEDIKALHIPLTRFYGLGDERYDLNTALDKTHEVCQKLDLSESSTILEFETQSAQKVIPPGDWAKGVKHSRDKGYPFRYWEVSNEPYAILTGAPSAFPKPEDYLTHVREVSTSIKNIDPDAQIGLAIKPDHPGWGNWLIKNGAGYYDFVVGHYYSSPDIYNEKPEDTILTANYKRLDDILKIQALINTYNPGKKIIQLDTEWGLHSKGKNHERPEHLNQNANILGTLHRAVRLIYYLRENILSGASSWVMFTHLNSPAFGFLTDESDKKSMLYWLYYYFARHMGYWSVDITGNAPYHTGFYQDEEFSGPLTPMVASLSRDKKTIYMIIANGSWDQTVLFEARIKNFIPSRVTAKKLDHGDMTAHPFIGKESDVMSDFEVELENQKIQCKIPPHSVIFLVLK